MQKKNKPIRVLKNGWLVEEYSINFLIYFLKPSLLTLHMDIKTMTPSSESQQQLIILQMILMMQYKKSSITVIALMKGSDTQASKKEDTVYFQL